MQELRSALSPTELTLPSKKPFFLNYKKKSFFDFFARKGVCKKAQSLRAFGVTSLNSNSVVPQPSLDSKMQHGGKSPVTPLIDATKNVATAAHRSNF